MATQGSAKAHVPIQRIVILDLKYNGKMFCWSKHKQWNNQRNESAWRNWARGRKKPTQFLHSCPPCTLPQQPKMICLPPWWSIWEQTNTNSRNLIFQSISVFLLFCLLSHVAPIHCLLNYRQEHPVHFFCRPHSSARTIYGHASLHLHRYTSSTLLIITVRALKETQV